MADATRTETAGEVVWDTPDVNLTVQKSATELSVCITLLFTSPDATVVNWQEFEEKIRTDCVKAGLTIVG